MELINLVQILERARRVACAGMYGEVADMELAEEVHGELAELIEHLDGHTHHMDVEAVTPRLQALSEYIRRRLA